MYDDEPRPSSGLAAAIPAAAAALIFGVCIGAAAGYLAHSMMSDDDGGKVIIPPAAVIKAEISDEDLASLCEELTEDEAAKAREAQNRVESLQSQLSAKETELAELQKEAEGDTERAKAAAKKWRAMEKEIEELRSTLTVAEKERDEARAELKQTIVALDKQIKKSNRLKEKADDFREKAKEYKSESTQNLWSSFKNDAKVQICDRGTKKRHESCHEEVEGAFSSSMRDKFSVCVDTYQAVPVLKESEKGEALPQFAAWLPEENKFTKGWYVIFCDPTLPEAGVDRSLEAFDADIDGPDDVPVGTGTEAGSGLEGMDDPSGDDEENLDDLDALDPDF